MDDQVPGTFLTGNFHFLFEHLDVPDYCKRLQNLSMSPPIDLACDLILLVLNDHLSQVPQNREQYYVTSKLSLSTRRFCLSTEHNGLVSTLTAVSSSALSRSKPDSMLVAHYHYFHSPPSQTSECPTMHHHLFQRISRNQPLPTSTPHYLPHSTPHRYSLISLSSRSRSHSTESPQFAGKSRSIYHHAEVGTGKRRTGPNDQQSSQSATSIIQTIGKCSFFLPPCSSYFGSDSTGTLHYEHILHFLN
jgi:hypothetical protein